MEKFLRVVMWGWHHSGVSKEQVGQRGNGRL